MTQSCKSYVHGLLTLALALCMLTLVPVASSSFTGQARQGGTSVIHKNGATPEWMAKALILAKGGEWI